MPSVFPSGYGRSRVNVSPRDQTVLDLFRLVEYSPTDSIMPLFFYSPSVSYFYFPCVCPFLLYALLSLFFLTQYASETHPRAHVDEKSTPLPPPRHAFSPFEDPALSAFVIAHRTRGRVFRRILVSTSCSFYLGILSYLPLYLPFSCLFYLSFVYAASLSLVLLPSTFLFIIPLH